MARVVEFDRVHGPPEFPRRAAVIGEGALKARSCSLRRGSRAAEDGV
jgi:hypothetical protein